MAATNSYSPALHGITVAQRRSREVVGGDSSYSVPSVLHADTALHIRSEFCVWGVAMYSGCSAVPCLLQTVSAAHFRLLVTVAFTATYWRVQSHRARALHIRSDVAVGAVDWYCASAVHLV